MINNRHSDFTCNNSQINETRDPGTFSDPQQKQTERMRISGRQREDGEGGGRVGAIGRWDYVVSRIYLTYIHTHTHTQVRGELSNASAHWAIPRARPGLPAVVVSENFGNKLTRGPRQRARVRGDLAAPRRWQWQRQDSFTSCITLMGWPLTAATTVVHRHDSSSRCVPTGTYGAPFPREYFFQRL